MSDRTKKIESDPLKRATRALRLEQFHRLKAESRVMVLESQFAAMRLDVQGLCVHCRAKAKIEELSADLEAKDDRLSVLAAHSTERADKAESRVMDLESQCASMRLEIHNRCDHCRACVQPTPAFSADAGRKLTERVQALERVVKEARRINDAPPWPDDSGLEAALTSLDALESKR